MQAGRAEQVAAGLAGRGASRPALGRVLALEDTVGVAEPLGLPEEGVRTVEITGVLGVPGRFRGLAGRLFEPAPLQVHGRAVRRGCLPQQIVHTAPLDRDDGRA